MTRDILNALLCTVAESTDGAPEGILYAALMGRIDLDTFQRAVAFMKANGLVRAEGFVLFPTDKLLAALAAAKAAAPVVS